MAQLVTSSLTYPSGLTTTTTAASSSRTQTTTAASSSRTQTHDEPLNMARLISNLIDAMAAPSSLTAAPFDWGARAAAAAPCPRDDASTSTSSSLSIACSRCEERAPTLRCLDCNDLYCYDCCHAITSDCHLREHTLTAIKQVSPIGMRSTASGAGAGAGAAAYLDKDALCDMHGEPVCFFCDSCTTLVCKECTMTWMHKDHRLNQIRSGSDNCRISMLKALETGKQGTKSIKQAIDRAVAISKSLEKDSVEVSLKIRRAMRYFVQAIEEREKFLLEKVEKMRQYKLQELSEQMNSLRGVLAGLAHTNETLVNCLDLEGVDLIRAKEKSIAQIDQYAGIYKKMQPKEDGIYFVPPNYELLEQLRKQCDVVPASLSSMPYQLSMGGGAASLSDHAPASRMLGYYDAGHGSMGLGLDVNAPRGIGQAISGFWPSVSMKPTRDPVSGVPVLSFAREGQEEGQVSRPWGLCVDRDGNIIVADRRNNRIQIFSCDGRFKTMFGSKGTGPGEFDLPAGITTDINGRIIVIDKDNHRVQVFTATGQFMLKFGSFGKECGQFQYPWDVAVNTIGNIAVTDTRNHRIQLFTGDGTYITKFVFESANPQKMLKGPTTPRGVCFTTTGHLIVSDFENHRLILIDSSLSRMMCAVGREGSGNTELNRPSGIVTDDEGRIIVADSKNHRVMVYSADMRYQWAVDLKSPGLDDKDRPSDVALTPDGYLVVLFETLPDTARDSSSHGKQYIKVY